MQRLYGPKFGGPVGYGHCLLWAEFFMGKDVDKGCMRKSFESLTWL